MKITCLTLSLLILPLTLPCSKQHKESYTSIQCNQTVLQEYIEQIDNTFSECRILANDLITHNASE